MFQFRGSWNFIRLNATRKLSTEISRTDRSNRCFGTSDFSRPAGIYEFLAARFGWLDSYRANLRFGFPLCTVAEPSSNRVELNEASSVPVLSGSDHSSDSAAGTELRVKRKRLDKTARHIMQILDKEAVEEVKSQRAIPDIQPGYVVRIKMEVPENKRRQNVWEGIVIARRNSGITTTVRIMRQVDGIGVESVLPLYSPNIKEIQVLEKKRVRRAKLYYLRDRMKTLKKQQ